VPTYAGPVVAVSCFVAGIVWWLWRLHIAPALGWIVVPLQERTEGLNVYMTFEVRISFNSWRIDIYVVAAADHWLQC